MRFPAAEVPAGNLFLKWPFISGFEAHMVCDMLRITVIDMGHPQREVVEKAASVERQAPVNQAKYRLDSLSAARIAKHLVILEPTESIVVDLATKARVAIPGLTSSAEFLRVWRHDPNFMLVVTRKTKFDPAKPSGDGLIAFLPLNMLGMQHLALGTFNAAAPDFRLLAKPHERPAGIYLWCVYLPGPLAAGMALLMERLSSEQYAGVNIYARAATEDGRRFCQVLGFTQGIVVGEVGSADIWTFSRELKKPLYDSYDPEADRHTIGVTVARTFEDMLRVFSIRNAVYVGEQECPYGEEYDGNDLSGTHLIVYIGREPVGSLRLRFFADFAKIERLAVRKEFRGSKAAFELVRASFEFCQKKGYESIYAHSQLRAIDFWHRFGFRVMENRKRFTFSDFDYVEMIAEIERDRDAIAIGADPYVIIRPEGRWHTPGILEESVSRAATNPSVKKKP